MEVALLFVGALLAAVLLRATWGLALWLARPESLGGWLLRGGLVWAVVKAMGIG